MSKDNITDFHKMPPEIKLMLNDKQTQYGDYGATAYVMKGITEAILSGYNGYVVKVPIEFWETMNISEKNWRKIKNKNYKADTYDDVLGFNELGRMLKIQGKKNEK
tara:strand:- start:67 stop:384 length:318 start_codon:yes stop_codon:yes gene_type:complete